MSREALNRRRTALRTLGIKHAVEGLTLTFRDSDGALVTLDYSDEAEHLRALDAEIDRADLECERAVAAEARVAVLEGLLAAAREVGAGE